MAYIHPEKVLGYEFEPQELSYTPRDLCLYALGLGIGENPTNKRELQFVYENNADGFFAFPTFSVNFAFGFLPNIANIPGLSFDPMMLLHGEHELEIVETLKTQDIITNYAKVISILDKKSGAVLEIEANSKNSIGQLLAVNKYTIFIKGLGGFGGEPGKSKKKLEYPSRSPDIIEDQNTTGNQALLYRLSGDKNPLHADPLKAQSVGYEKQILHGLATFGISAKAVIARCCDCDSSKFKSMKARFSKHVFPGETLRTMLWVESNHISVKTIVLERDVEVLTNGIVYLEN